MGLLFVICEAVWHVYTTKVLNIRVFAVRYFTNQEMFEHQPETILNEEIRARNATAAIAI